MLFNVPSTNPDETSGFCRSSNAEFNLFVGTAHSRVAVLVVSSTISLSTYRPLFAVVWLALPFGSDGAYRHRDGRLRLTKALEKTVSELVADHKFQFPGWTVTSP